MSGSPAIELEIGHRTRAARAFACEVERRLPDLVTTAGWKRDRIAAVFVDWNQNTRDHTIRSAYSVRGVPEAVVSTPVGRPRRALTRVRAAPFN